MFYSSKKFIPITPPIVAGKTKTIGRANENSWIQTLQANLPKRNITYADVNWMAQTFKGMRKDSAKMAPT